MTRVVIGLIGADRLSDEALRDAIATLATRIDVHRVGSTVRERDEIAVAVVARTEGGPVALDRLLGRLALGGGVTYRILAYGALIYRSVGLDVPPRAIAPVALRSLAQADPEYDLPGLGKVTAHLAALSDRRE